MNIASLLRQILVFPPGDWEDWIPADHISRQAWQNAVECLVERMRTELGTPEFALSETEISVHYHLPLEKFAALVSDRLDFGS